LFIAFLAITTNKGVEQQITIYLAFFRQRSDLAQGYTKTMSNDAYAIHSGKFMAIKLVAQERKWVNHVLPDRGTC
jgi:cytochrome c1